LAPSGPIGCLLAVFSTLTPGKRFRRPRFWRRSGERR
jgi:hypothetical protein